MYDFIIIGGGISGLYMATQLRKNNHIMLLEQNDYFGGRIYQHEETIDGKSVSEILEETKRKLREFIES